MSLAIAFLYSFEDRNIYQQSREALYAKYQPASVEEENLVDRIISATWLRKRYAQTTHHVIRQIETEEEKARPDAAQLERFGRSLARFQREYRNQRRSISILRNILRRTRLGLPTTEVCDDLMAA
jgi:hypothetical protein